MIIKPFSEKQVGSFNELKGQKNEKQCAYYLDFEYKNSPTTMVFHDLRLEYNGRVAQIDHLVMSPAAIYVIENKYFSGVLSKNSYDNWSVKYESKEISIPSPILQNERHILLLRELLSNENIMPKGLFGKRIIPNIYNVVMVSEKTIIQGDMPENVIKIDSFRSYIEKIKKSYLINPIKALTADILPDNKMKEIAEKLLRYHKEKVYFSKKVLKEVKIKTPEQALIDFKAIRKNLSKDLGIEAYKIFTDATLIEMSEKQPKNKEEMLRISGVGEVKFERFGGYFLS